MGNTATTTTTRPAHIATNDTSNYEWPENLYVETRDMLSVSFLVYDFGYILEAARREKDGLKGMHVDKAGRVDAPSRRGRTFTPREVAKIIQENSDKLAKHFLEVFTDTSQIGKALEMLQQRAEVSGLARPLTLLNYDDKYQRSEMLYAVAKDDVNKRITLVFRGTDSKFATTANWATNLSPTKRLAALPAYLRDKVNFDQVWLHCGFYSYVFDPTADESDDPWHRRYDDILNDLRPALKANPGYMLYVTGHSLGGALSGLVSFFLACEPDIPKPVTCLNFGSPRIGDRDYLQAVQVLEQERQLRFCRIVNYNDSITVFPVFNYYHAGFQVLLYEDAKPHPVITYPNLEGSSAKLVSRGWGSFLTGFTIYDLGDYLVRLEQNREQLEKDDLNELYKNTELTGWD